MTKPPGDAVAYHRIPDGCADDQADARTTTDQRGLVNLCAGRQFRRIDETWQCIEMHHHVMSTTASATPHHRREVFAMTQAVPFRQQLWIRASVRLSGSQRGTALVAASCHDRTACTGTHAQPEAMNARATPVVRLKCPLALAHGDYSSIYASALAAPLTMSESPSSRWAPNRHVLPRDPRNLITGLFHSQHRQSSRHNG